MSKHMKPELVAVQHQLEQEALDRGAARYRKALERGEDTMPPGMKLIKAATKPMAEAVQTLITDTLSGRAGKLTNVVKFLSQFDPEIASYITIKTVLAMCSNRLRNGGVMDKARMNTTAAHPVVACAYAQLSVLDGEDPALQALAPALLFLTICQEMRLDVSEMLAKVHVHPGA